MPDLYGAIDLGGTKLRAIVADLDGNVLGEIIRPSEADEGPEPVIARMIETLEAAAGKAGVSASQLRAVGVASPGALDLVHGLVFEARVGDRELQGLDLIRADADGRIAEFTVMIRPASGLMALAERMGPALQAAGV